MALFGSELLRSNAAPPSHVAGTTFAKHWSGAPLPGTPAFRAAAKAQQYVIDAQPLYSGTLPTRCEIRNVGLENRAAGRTPSPAPAASATEHAPRTPTTPCRVGRWVRIEEPHNRGPHWVWYEGDGSWCYDMSREEEAVRAMHLRSVGIPRSLARRVVLIERHRPPRCLLGVGTLGGRGEYATRLRGDGTAEEAERTLDPRSAWLRSRSRSRSAAAARICSSSY